MEKKWYVINQSAEEDSYSIIRLTAKQAENFQYVLNNMLPVFGGGYCGNIYIYEQSFDTYDEAFDFAMEQFN